MKKTTLSLLVCTIFTPLAAFAGIGQNLSNIPPAAKALLIGMFLIAIVCMLAPFYSRGLARFISSVMRRGLDKYDETTEKKAVPNEQAVEEAGITNA